jgi:hypothetical protein
MTDGARVPKGQSEEVLMRCFMAAGTRDDVG